MDRVAVIEEIKVLRQRLDNLLKGGRTISDREVVAVSQEIDTLVMLYYAGVTTDPA